jgi:hypothetical protein
MRSVLRLHKESIVRQLKPVGSARELKLKGASQRGLEPLDTEAEDATPSKPQLSSAVKTVTENTCLSVTVICIVQSELCKSSINPITNQNPVYTHALSRDIMLRC